MKPGKDKTKPAINLFVLHQWKRLNIYTIIIEKT